MCREHEPDGVLPPADAQRVDLEPRPLAGDRGADLEHVRTEDQLVAAREVVRVVLHERHAARQAGTHHLERADHRCGLPVTLGPEAVAVGHEPLDREAGQLAQAVEVLERVGEGDGAAFGDERSQPDLLARAVAEAVRPRAARSELGGHVVLVEVLRHQPVRLGVADGVHRSREVADAPGVDAEAQPALRLDLVALGDGDLAHVVADADDAAIGPVVAGGRSTRPGPDLLLHRRVAPVPHDHLAIDPQPRGDEPELAVAVGRLVQVHEVHVDVGPRDLAVELRVEVEEGLGEQLEARDPHPGRAEGVHPCDQADAHRVEVGLRREPADSVRVGEDRLEDHADRDGRRRIERTRDRLRMGGDGVEDLGAIEVLTAGDEPDLVLGEVQHRDRLPQRAGDGR